MRNKMSKWHKLYNGPQSWEASVFIKCIEERFDERPWTSYEELLIIRAFSVALQKIYRRNGKDKRYTER